MTKQEKIKQVYGEYYTIAIDDNGWAPDCRNAIYFKNPQFGDYRFDSLEGTELANSFRPRELEGIEHNNGWTVIEGVDDLPKKRGTYLVCKNGRFHGEFNVFNAEYRRNEMLKFSHWREKDEIKDPLY